MLRRNPQQVTPDRVKIYSEAELLSRQKYINNHHFLRNATILTDQIECQNKEKLLISWQKGKAGCFFILAFLASSFFKSRHWLSIKFVPESGPETFLASVILSQLLVANSNNNWYNNAIHIQFSVSYQSGRMEVTFCNLQADLAFLSKCC